MSLSSFGGNIFPPFPAARLSFLVEFLTSRSVSLPHFIPSILNSTFPPHILSAWNSLSRPNHLGPPKMVPSKRRSPCHHQRQSTTSKRTTRIQFPRMDLIQRP